MADTDAIMDGEDNPTSDTRPTCREKSKETHKKPDMVDDEVQGSDKKSAVNSLDIDGNDQNAAKVNTELITACQEGNCKDVSHLLKEEGANIEHRTESGLTPLMIAAKRGDTKLGKILLDGFADKNATCKFRDDDIYTSLSFAAKEGHFNFVNLLLGWGPDVDIKGGKSPLLLACDAGHLEVVNLLLQKTNYLPSNKDLQECIAVNKEQSDEIKREKCKKCIEEIVREKKRRRDDTATAVEETHNLDGRNESSAANTCSSELFPIADDAQNVEGSEAAIAQICNEEQGPEQTQSCWDIKVIQLRKDPTKNVEGSEAAIAQICNEEQGPEQTQSCWDIKVIQLRKDPTKNVEGSEAAIAQICNEEQGPEQTQSCWDIKVIQLRKDPTKNVEGSEAAIAHICNEEQGPEQTQSCWDIKIIQLRKDPTKIDRYIISIRNLTSQVACKTYILIWLRRLYRCRVGHVALLFSSSNFDCKYYSWYPRDSLKKLFSLFFLPGDLKKCFEDDLTYQGQPPDFIYEINNLNINVHDYIRDNQNSNYNFFVNNCCTMVINALISGGAPDIRTSWNISLPYIPRLTIYTPALINKYCMENFNKIEYIEFLKQYQNIKISNQGMH